MPMLCFIDEEGVTYDLVSGSVKSHKLKGLAKLVTKFEKVYWKQNGGLFLRLLDRVRDGKKDQRNSTQEFDELLSFRDGHDEDPLGKFVRSLSPSVCLRVLCYIPRKDLMALQNDLPEFAKECEAALEGASLDSYLQLKKSQASARSRDWSGWTGQSSLQPSQGDGSSSAPQSPTLPSLISPSALDDTVSVGELCNYLEKSLGKESKLKILGKSESPELRNLNAGCGGLWQLALGAYTDLVWEVKTARGSNDFLNNITGEDDLNFDLTVHEFCSYWDVRVGMDWNLRLESKVGARGPRREFQTVYCSASGGLLKAGCAFGLADYARLFKHVQAARMSKPTPESATLQTSL